MGLIKETREYRSGELGTRLSTNNSPKSKEGLWIEDSDKSRARANLGKRGG